MPTDQHIAAGLLGRVAYGRVAASVRALPFLAPARHIVADGRVLLRMHKGHGHHLVCAGTVVAYGADNMNSAPDGVERWSVQVVGVCEAVEPTDAQLERFGPGPLRVDGAPFEAVYLEIAPRLATVHSMGIAVDITAEHPNEHIK
ncbi:pyridoxamine 5'-phosphate oxidase family protein [Streptomyces sp. NBC_00414]|uniref:pyridoxamine 5'-phosphate oxidase family protein n=1 Tax=Streptomyces sp. NBC_00414 TaxID=2975739 RepID=UPI002E228A08